MLWEISCSILIGRIATIACLNAFWVHPEQNPKNTTKLKDAVLPLPLPPKQRKNDFRMHYRILLLQLSKERSHFVTSPPHFTCGVITAFC